MAQLTSKTELTTPADDDLIHIIDVSDTTDGVNGTSKKIQKSNLVTGGEWGTITGTLSNQTDLQTALDGKVDENSPITPATKTKITYDAKGLVTAGADIIASDISDFQTTVSSNTDVSANTSARHDALTVTDSSEIDFTLTGQDLTASLKAGSIDETKLDTSVNASLDLADSSLQTSDIGSSIQAYDDDLTDIAALTHTKGNLIASNGTDWVNVGVGSNNQVLTADSLQTAGIKWADASGGGASATMTVTAGETLSQRDYVYIDTTDGKAYKVDTDASPIKNGATRGFVTESGGIATDSTGEITITGEVTGFTGLTAWNYVYASSTAGGYTQTKPSPTKSGSQIAIITVGIATSTTAIYAFNNEIVQYMKRDDVADDGTLTITHHSDSLGYNRVLNAYIADTTAGSSLTDYADSNQDDEFQLKGQSGAGGTLDVNASGSSADIGDNGGTEYRQAQQFTPQATGTLSQFKFTLAANTGSPSGDIFWQIRNNDSSGPNDVPGTLITTGNQAVTPSAENTVNVSDGPFLDGSTKYWIVLRTPSQVANNHYNWTRGTTDVYASHLRAESNDAGATWTTASQDFAFEVTTSAVTSYDQLAQSFQVTGAQTVASITAYLKKVGSPTGNLTVEIQTDSGSSPSGTAITNGTSNTVSASTLTTSFADTSFTFSTPPSLSGSTTYWIVLKTADTQSNTDYVLWGSDTSSPSYADGEMKGYVSLSWSSLTADAIFEVFAPGTTFVEPANAGFSDATGGNRVTFAYHDGSFADSNTKSTMKNISGTTKDLTFVAEIRK